MSVRRLAKEQPASFAFSPETMEKVNWWIAKYPDDRKRSAVIPILWLVLEVATFYTMFQLEPVGKAALIQVCGTTPCMLRGAGALMEVCKDKIGPKDHLSKDGLFTWQEVECLGACCNAPMAQINDYFYEDLTPESLGQIIADFAAGKEPQPGSYIGRKASEPHEAVQTLLDPKLYDGSAAKKIAKLPNLPEPEPAA